MRLHCNTYDHWKDILICSMSCPYTQRCKQFRSWREEEGNEAQMWERILRYLRSHPHNTYELLFTPIAAPKKIREKIVKRYACIREDEMKILTEEEITENLLQGIMFEEIFELGRQMEIQVRLIPAPKKAKAATDTKETKAEAPQTKENGVGRGGKKKKAQTQAEA